MSLKLKQAEKLKSRKMKDEWMIDFDRLGGFGDGQTDTQTNNQLEIDSGSCRVIFETEK